MTDLFPALVFDCESTDLMKGYGKDNPADAEGQPRIVSISASLIDDIAGSHVWVGSLNYLIKPDGWTISPDALATHGVTLEYCEVHGVPIATAMADFERLHDRAALTVAFNHGFDSKLVRGELRRLGRPDRYGMIPDFCCMWGSRAACDLPKKKLPNLAEAMRVLCGVEHTKATGAHSAAGDRDATVTLYLELVKRGLVVPKVRNVEPKAAAE